MLSQANRVSVTSVIFMSGSSGDSRAAGIKSPSHPSLQELISRRMRSRGGGMRLLAMIIGLAIAAAHPGLAGQSGNTLDLSGPAVGLPRAADRGKPMLSIQPPVSNGLN